MNKGDRMITPHWDITSLIMYVVLGGHSVFCIYSVQKKIVINNRRIFTNMYYISLIFIWDIIASFRYVDVNIGGNDTLGYIQYFEECLIATKGIPFVLEEHFEPLFKVICKSIRLFTADYHVFFLILYGFIIYSFLLFIEEFVTKQTSKIPFVLLIFEFWRGFNTFRTTLALSFILLGLVMFHKGKEKRGLLIAAMSIFIHSASIIYFMIIPFLHICKRRKFKIWQGMVFALGIYVCTRGMQRFLLTTGSPVLELFDTGAMRGYLSHSLKKSIFSFNMITLEHTALFITMMLFNKEIKASMENKSIEEKKK